MIGVFDSGFGGLTIFKEIEKSLPNYDYLYLGDNARAPYGNLSQDVIYRYTKQAIDYLFNQGCNLIILACNTASAEALRKIQQEYLPSQWPQRNVLGVVRPLAEQASLISQNKKIAVMGTQSTIDSQAYIKELKAQNNNIQIYQQACPLLVPIIESSQEAEPATQTILQQYIEPLKKNNPDVVILGCTHYGWLTQQIQAEFGQASILDSGQIVATKLVDYLQRHQDLVKESNSRQRIFLTTGDNIKFDKAAEKFLGRKIVSQKISL